jgi:predicted ABC-type ATPase
MPLVNADRMMLSILPDVAPGTALPEWASRLRDTNESWMQVAQNGVKAFVGHAMNAKVPFAMETVFSHWQEKPDGTVDSKIGMIRDLQAAGYFVLLVFVGLASVELSVNRVATRVLEHGHGVPEAKLRSRFPRTQRAIAAALEAADASLLTDNSRDQKQAFTVCRVEIGHAERFDVRAQSATPPKVILRWLEIVASRA